MFLFPNFSSYSYSDDDLVQRSYLLRYDTTTMGSWINFFVGVGGRNAHQLQKIHILISDLASTGAERDASEIVRIIDTKSCQSG